MMVQAGSGGQNLLDLWDRRRLVAVDVETLMEARRHRVISLGIVTCRQGAERGQHHWLVNPGIPIDSVTQRIHGLRDRDLMGERSFEELMLELMGLFVGVPGERVVLVAHQANFDIPVIRDECDRVGFGMPDLPVLDTAGPVLALLGVKPKSRRLGDLLATLGLHNPEPHKALHDAIATARAACRLIEIAADAGYDSFDRLLADVGAGTAMTLSFAGPTGAPKRIVPLETLPADHAATHARVLPAKLDKAARRDWEKQVAACARLRCEYLTDQIATAEAPPSVLLPTLLGVLGSLVRAGNGPAAATVAGAIGRAFDGLQPKPGRWGMRRAAEELDRTTGALLNSLPRCDRSRELPVLCPGCAEGGTCGLDSWRYALAPCVLGYRPSSQETISEGVARSFMQTTGAAIGRGGYADMRRRGRVALADAALRVAYAYWIEVNQASRATQVAAYAWSFGSRDPVIADAHASDLAAGGREADLRAARQVCLDRSRPGPTAPTNTGPWSQRGRRSTAAGSNG